MTSSSLIQWRSVCRIATCCLLFAFCFACDLDPDESDPGTMVSTVAGGDTPGFVDGTGSGARFNYPCGMVVDSDGNLYVADHSNHSIRKITPGGEVTTFAGTGQPGAEDGYRLEASFNLPYGLAIDHEGTLYIGDVANHRIRRIDKDGMVSTLAGNYKGFSDNQGSVAKFNQPYGVAVDADKNVYVADTHNNRIRKIAPDGTVRTLAGSGNDGFVDGQGRAAEFYVPIGIVIDAKGNVYVGDEGNSSVRKIAPDGGVTTLAGSGKFSFSDGVGEQAAFNAPGGIAIDGEGNLYVADYLNNCIRKVSPAGKVSTIAGNREKGFADGPASQAEFYYPFGIAVDASGVVYVGDQFNHRVRKIESVR